jgi:V/A-type H+-transporting ATPase subunit C
LEKYLLTPSDVARLEEIPSLQECYEALARYHQYSESLRSYGENLNYGQALEQEWARTYQELKGFVPEPDLLDLFWLEHDMHNIKVILKLLGQGKVLEDLSDVELLSASGTISLDMLYAALVRGDLHALPFPFSSLVSEARSMLEKEARPRELDMFIDRRFFQILTRGLLSYQDPFLDLLARKLIDAENIKALLRIRLWERDEEQTLLSTVLVSGGSIPPEAILGHAGETLESLIDVFRGSAYFSTVQHGIEEWHNSQSLQSVDQSLDNDILQLLHQGAYITFGREPLIRYVFLKKGEITRLRHVLRTKQSGVSRASMGAG